MPYPSAGVNLQKTVQVINEHEHEPSFNYKRVGLVSPDTGVVLGTADNPLEVKAKLKVDDIEIGAVEIKDANSETRVDVETVGTHNAILIKDVTEYQKQKINNFGSSVVAPGATIILATYTVPAGKRFTYSGGTVGGTEIGEFYFEINSNTQSLVRNSGSNPTIFVQFIEPPEASAGSVIELKVKNISNKTRSYEVTLSGYIINI